MKVETNPKVLVRQQVVLAHLGYYSGKLDGIWSAATIKAKCDFENSGKFVPGIPNRGLPFVSGMPLPKGMFADPIARGLLTATGLTEDVIETLTKSRQIKRSAPVQNNEPTAEVKTEVKVEEVIPKAEATESEAPVQNIQKPKHTRHR